MTLPAQGNSISMGQVNTELELSATALISLNDTAVRTLFEKASGTISLFDGFGKINRAKPAYTFATNTANASINVNNLPGYVAGKSDIVITVNSGIYVYGTTNGTPALTLTGTIAAGDTVILINNGFIIGKGGDGAIVDHNYNTSTVTTTQPTTGSTALSLGFNITITNTSGYIGGGGGAGGSIFQTVPLPGLLVMGGGGAGGGTGGTVYENGSLLYAGGTGGTPGNTGGTSTGTAGGGGGRIIPGTGGAATSAAGTTTVPSGNATPGNGGGAGGGGAAETMDYWMGKTEGYEAGGGGGGGGWGASGGSAAGNLYNAVGYAGYGGAGGSANSAGGNGSYQAGAGSAYAPVAGTAGGKGVALNGYTVTWTGGTSSSSRVYGAVS